MNPCEAQTSSTGNLNDIVRKFLESNSKKLIPLGNRAPASKK
jgi:hypothetical protein